MQLTWLGHSCFLMEEDGYRLIIDPYHEVDGYPDLHAQAHEILSSHDHFDHNYAEAVTLLPPRESPFRVRAVSGTFHDEEQGALRGPNTIHIVEGGGVKLAHLGDLGCALTQEQVDEIGKCDVLLVPVGGFFTIDGDMAAQTAEQLGGGTLVPMHYREGPYGFDKISGPDLFLSHFKAEQICRLSGNTFTVEPASGTRVIIPAFQG